MCGGWKKRERQLTVASFVEAMGPVAVRGEDGDGVAQVLEADGGVDDEAFGAADAEVRVKEDDVLLLCAHGGFGGCSGLFPRTGSLKLVGLKLCLRESALPSMPLAITKIQVRVQELIQGV